LDIFCGFIRTISSLQNDLSTLPLSDFLLFKNYSNSKIEQAAKVKPIEGIGAVSRHLGKLGRLTGIKRKMRYLLGFFLPELSFYSGKTKREIYRLHYGEHFSKVDAIASSLWGKTEKTS